MTIHFKYAIVRKPAKSMVNGITEAHLGKPDYEKALQQHSDYIKALESCGLKVKVLEADERFPDSCFVEDVSVCTSKFAVITNPGAESRNGEIVEMKDILPEYFDEIRNIDLPGTLDGGDVMMVEDHFYIGLSDRTNTVGATQLIDHLAGYGFTGSIVTLNEMLHLKTGINYIGDGNFLVTGEFIDHPAFKDLNKHIISEEEAYAANSLWVNGTIIVPADFPKTQKLIEELGYKTILVDTSEFRKLDGGLSCLSLRF